MTEHQVTTWAAVGQHDSLYGRDGQAWRVEWIASTRVGWLDAELRRPGAHPLRVTKRDTDPAVKIVPTEDEAIGMIVQQLGGIVEGITEDEGRLWQCPQALDGFRLRDHLRDFHGVHAGKLAKIKDAHTPHLHTVMHTQGTAQDK